MPHNVHRAHLFASVQADSHGKGRRLVQHERAARVSRFRCPEALAGWQTSRCYSDSGYELHTDAAFVDLAPSCDAKTGKPPWQSRANRTSPVRCAKTTMRGDHEVAGQGPLGTLRADRFHVVKALQTRVSWTAMCGWCSIPSTPRSPEELEESMKLRLWLSLRACHRSPPAALAQPPPAPASNAAPQAAKPAKPAKRQAGRRLLDRLGSHNSNAPINVSSDNFVGDLATQNRHLYRQCDRHPGRHAAAGRPGEGERRSRQADAHRSHRQGGGERHRTAPARATMDFTKWAPHYHDDRPRRAHQGKGRDARHKTGDGYEHQSCASLCARHARQSRAGAVHSAAAARTATEQRSQRPRADKTEPESLPRAADHRSRAPGTTTPADAAQIAFTLP